MLKTGMRLRIQGARSIERSHRLISTSTSLESPEGKRSRRSARMTPVREASFHPALASYLVTDFLPRKQISTPTILPNAISKKKSCLDAIDLMKKTKEDIFLTALIVQDDAKTGLDGVITEKDIVQKAFPLVLQQSPSIATNINGIKQEMNKISVEQVMTVNPTMISEHQSLDEAIELLCKGDLRYLPVTKVAEGKGKTSAEEKEIIGVLGINDTLSELFRVEVLHKYHQAAKQSLGSLHAILGKQGSSASVSSLCVVKENDSVVKTIKKMIEQDTSTALVIASDGSDELKGIFSQHDFTYKVVLNNGSENQVGKYITSIEKIVCLNSEKSILNGLETIVAKKHRHIPLLGKASDSDGTFPKHKETGRIVTGMLSAKDIIKYVYQI